MSATLTYYHYLMQFLVLIVITMVCVHAFLSWKKGKRYTKTHEILSRINIGFTHGQMLLGIILLTHSNKVSYSNSGTSSVSSGYWSYTHPIVMFLAIVLVTLALMLVRNNKPDVWKHRTVFLCNIIALILMISGVITIPS